MIHDSERVNDLLKVFRIASDSLQARLWTALPCIVDSYDATAQTAALTPAVKAQLEAPDGTLSWVTIGQLLDVPVVFPKGGGFTLTFPIAVGDEALVVFASRCIDGWWDLGGVQQPPAIRFHDLSDGFAFVGPTSKPRKLANVSTSTVQLRSDDGSTFVELTGEQVANVIAPGGINLTSSTGNITIAAQAGNVSISAPSGSVTAIATGCTIDAPVQTTSTVDAAGEGTFDGHTVGQHTHTQGADSHGDTEVPTNPPTG